MRRFVGTWSFVVLGVVACGPGATDDGAQGADGTEAAGGSVGTGGAKSTGGATGSGGTKATGGANGGGGAKASGGATGSGGAKATGGTNVTDAGQPHVVLPCPSGMAAVGVWENVTPPGIVTPRPSCGSGPCDYGAKEVLLDPQNSATVFHSEDKHGIYKSTDCAATWTKINTGRNGATLDTGAQWSMAIDPVEPNVMYANNGYGSEQGLWKTTNGGVDWDQLFPKGSLVATTVEYNFAHIMSMDPTDRTHLVVSFHAQCTGAYAPGCLAETNDSGATWRLIKLPVSAGEASGVALIDSNTWLYGIPFTSLHVTTDRGATWKQAANDGGYTLYKSADGKYYLAGGANGILRSSDGLAWTKLNSGPMYSVVGTGTTLYASPRYCDKDCYRTSPENDGTTWTTIATQVSGHGAVNLAYDPDHHILYSSNETGGFWRVVTH